MLAMVHALSVNGLFYMVSCIIWDNSRLSLPSFFTCFLVFWAFILFFAFAFLVIVDDMLVNCLFVKDALKIVVSSAHVV